MTENFTILETYSNPYTFSDFIFGIPTWEMTLIFIGFAAVISLVIYLYFGSFFISLATNVILSGIGAFMGLIPAWAVIVMAVFGLSILLFQPTDEEIPDDAIDYWDAYGQRIKEAYSAKFGGENNGFNQEIDSRILIMKKCRRGFTNTIARDYLRRMRNFTEAK